ncbi:mis6 domain containing protein [Niveomyces insectorum RCEF 264]|uniref:Mis6 domain containing protein n=1 Tax=Niveomyces insectorum RCEF 264 TaxID=1081102 RepID=A0A167X466_9HYPO|nr:mis6 domain containing protein [Niveomyces insectorum RCEF 264]
MDPLPDEEITALVGDLVQAARVPAQRRPFAVKPTVERLTALAYEHGLPPDALRDLVHVITAPGHLDQASLGALARHLYPSGGAAVADDVVLAVVGCLGHGQLKPALPVQALLLRWLVLVYHVLASPAVLSRAYAVLFNLLDTAGIRPPLCHVLALITRRRHVRPFRIQAILNLSRQTGHDPHLIGLLRVFKNYYPEVIVGEATRGRASPFKHPDPQWRARLDEIVRLPRQHRLDNSGRIGGGGDADAPYNGFRVRQDHQKTPGHRVGGGPGIPAVHTSHAQEASVTLEEIDSADALVQNLEKIELPNQLVAVLADPLLQKLLLLRPAEDAFARVDHWLMACIASAASGDGGRDSELMDLLEVVHDYTLPPVLLRYFDELLSRRDGKVYWDGNDKRELVLEALAYVSVGDFQETYDAVFAPLEAKLLDNSVASQLDLLTFYTLVLRHWAVALAAGDGHVDDAAASAPAPGTNKGAALTAFIQHVNGLVLVVLQNSISTTGLGSPEPGDRPWGGSVSTPSALAVLAFYDEVVAVLALRRDDVLAQVQELIPPPAAVYTLHFHQSAAIASRLYAVLAAFKKALEAAMARRPGRGGGPAGPTATEPVDATLATLAPQLTPQERARVNLFNGFLMDVCNCLWRSRAFSASDTNAQGCRVPGAVVDRLAAYVQGLDRDLALTAAFSLSYSPTFCLQAVSHPPPARGPRDAGGAGAAGQRRRARRELAGVPVGPLGVPGAARLWRRVGADVQHDEESDERAGGTVMGKAFLTPFQGGRNF